VEIILSILLSFLVFLTYSEMIHIKLSAVRYAFGMSEFCMQNTYLTCTAYFVFLYFYDFSMSYSHNA
jgi:hypothetical protein